MVRLISCPSFCRVQLIPSTEQRFIPMWLGITEGSRGQIALLMVVSISAILWNSVFMFNMIHLT